MPILSEKQLAGIFQEVRKDQRVQGILLAGSYAYGKPNEKSDLDLICVTNDGSDWAELDRICFGVPLNVFFNSPELIRNKYMQGSIDEGHGDCVHMWAYGKVIYDPNDVVIGLQEEAKRIWKEGPQSGKEWNWRWEKHKKYSGTYGQARLLEDKRS